MRECLPFDAGSLITVNPFRCRVWDLNDRIEEYVTEESCRAELDSVRRDGQLVPVVGRLLSNEPDFDVEVICGSRRLFVARHLRIPIRVEIRQLTDREAAVAVEAENSLRKQASPYERGLWLAKLLRQGIYHSQDEMARNLRISPTQVTRLLKFAELPALVIAAFPSPHDILESWAVELHKAWNDERRRLIIDRSRSLRANKSRAPAGSAYETLIGPITHARRATTTATRRIVKSPDGTTLLRCERQRNDVVLRIPNALVDHSLEEELAQTVAAVVGRRAKSGGTANLSHPTTNVFPAAGAPLTATSAIDKSVPPSPTHPQYPASCTPEMREKARLT